MSKGCFSEPDIRLGLSMSVVISDEILQASHLTPVEFRREIALHLFQTGRLTLGYAGQLAEMSPNAFRQFLKQRNVPLYSYDVEDFELDLKNLRDLGQLRLGANGGITKQLIGIAKTDESTPTDADVNTILDERLVHKYL